LRLDKYLKVSRILKKRTTSKELAEHERILVNGKIAKAATAVKPGDEIEISFGERRMKVRVLATPEYTRKEEASVMYEVIDSK
jgi:Ribosome-associated heat shock protein implicated in the recycling of the 50S subunit (S4 paralog)